MLGAVLHAPLPGDKRGRGKGKDAPATPGPAAGPGTSGTSGKPGKPGTSTPQPIPYEVAEPEQHIPGDGTDTVALRTVRMGRR